MELEKQNTKTSYLLCSESVIAHFPKMERSKPFQSGYYHDRGCLFYVIQTDDVDEISKYYNNVIGPFNTKSHIEYIEFWFREVCDSQLSDIDKECILKCRTIGIFKAIESIWGLTTETNRGYAIHKMASYSRVNPIEFINRVISDF